MQKLCLPRPLDRVEIQYGRHGIMNEHELMMRPIESLPTLQRSNAPTQKSRDANLVYQIKVYRPNPELANWGEALAYDEQLLSYIHCSFECKLTFNNRCITKDTEPNLVFTPGAF
jgi:hypothetical protein